MNEIETAAMLAELEGAWTAYYERVASETPQVSEDSELAALVREAMKTSFAQGYKSGLVNGSALGSRKTMDAFREGM